jgi:hypothetical protein
MNESFRMYSTHHWAPRIHAAGSEEQLVRIVRQYLATWLTSDLDRLPVAGELRVVSTGDDISTTAVVLVQAEVRDGLDRETAELMRQLTDVFVAAHLRLRQIVGDGPDRGELRSAM